MRTVGNATDLRAWVRLVSRNKINRNKGIPTWAAAERRQIMASILNAHPHCVGGTNKIGNKIVIQKNRVKTCSILVVQDSWKFCSSMIFTNSALHTQEDVDKHRVLEPGSAFHLLLKHWYLSASLTAETQLKHLHHVSLLHIALIEARTKSSRDSYWDSFCLSNHYHAGRRPLRGSKKSTVVFLGVSFPEPSKDGTQLTQPLRTICLYHTHTETVFACVRKVTAL